MLNFLQSLSLPCTPNLISKAILAHDQGSACVVYMTVIYVEVQIYKTYFAYMVMTENNKIGISKNRSNEMSLWHWHS